MVSQRKAVFLDKDGTLIENVPYNIDPAKMVLTRGSGKGLRILQDHGYDLIVISNQAGIAQGFFGIEDMLGVARKLELLLQQIGVRLSGFYYCPHHPQGVVDRFRKVCTCRKPEPGLIMLAAKEHRIDLSSSWFIGDILDDVEAGRRAGCRTILIDNGNETEWIKSPQRTPDHLASGLDEAAGIICRV